MDTAPNTQQVTRRAAMNGLAVVGFVALILIGIATAIYAATFLPKALSKLSTANVFLSSIGNTNNNQLQAVPSSIPVTNTPAPTTIPVSPAPTPVTTTPTPVVTTPTVPTVTTPTVTPAPVTPTYTKPVYQVVTVPASQNYYGLPDLTVHIVSVGYLRTYGDTSSYTTSSYVPQGYEGAIRFVVGNSGTNSVSNWNFEARLPTSDSSSYYRSSTQRALNPNDSITFTLGFDNGNIGNSRTVSVTVDPNNGVSESNEGNNTDSSSIDIRGNSNGNNNSSQYDSNGNYCSYGTYYSNGRTYCNSSSNSNNSSNNSQYSSSGQYCVYGTYYQAGNYYCSATSNNNSSRYDSNGAYCSYGTYYSNGRYYCSTNSSYNSGCYYSTGGAYVCQ